MRVSGALFLAVLVAAARAEDSSSPAGDSIATAKKDLASIKGPAGQDQSQVLPTLDMKDLGPAPGAAAPELPGLSAQEKEASLDPAKKKQGTGNWLVDAMDKKPEGARPGRSREKEDLLRGENDVLRSDEKVGSQGEKDAQVAEDSPDRAGAKDGTGTVYNPLDSFMSGWISSKDRDLLLPGAQAGETGRGHADTLPGLEMGQGGSFTESLVGPSDSGVFSDSRSAPNPYLSTTDLSPAPAAKWFLAPEGQGPSVPGLSDFPRGMSSSGVDPRPIDGSRTYVPDFAQPPDDDKYFKQLKRF